jgi:uncharacterized protein YukJ
MQSFFFSTGSPDGLLGAASRPSSTGKFEIETADDFVLTSPTTISSATFTGLITGGSTPIDVGSVTVEIYRVFPQDSNVGRTSGPPTFSTLQVPTRVNSPSDVDLVSRSSASGLTLTTSVLSATFSTGNSIQPAGINASPNQRTGGNGPITGEEVQFNVNFTSPFDLPAGHYFFVPQVEIDNPSGNFDWLSAPKPIVAPGTPFPSGFADLQAWTRDHNLDPDWLRVGTDIVGGSPAPTFNMTFSLTGVSDVRTPSSDFNADGTSDVLLQNGGTVVDWIMANGTYQNGNVITNGASGYTIVGTGDFNADGTSDVLLQSGGTVVDWIMKNGVYQNGNVITNGASGYKVVGTGDLNGDGTSDVVLQNGSTVVDWIMQNGVYQSGNVLTNVATGWTVVGTGDVNGDGTSDVLLQNGGTVVDWIIKNGVYQSGNVLTNGAVGWTVVGTGDFNGDGTSDVLLQNGSTVVDWIMGNGVYQSGNVITNGAVGWNVVGTGDYNGDGTSDVLLQNGGTVVDWTMKNGSFQSGNVITTGALGYTVARG